MKNLVFILSIVWIIFSCDSGNFGKASILARQVEPIHLISEEGSIIAERFLTPPGYQRIEIDKESFAYYLRNLPLKPHGSKVMYYNEKIKSSMNVYLGVVDMDIGQRDLLQCADAIMRLRGEYLFLSAEYDRIHFNFISDGKPRYYLDYAKGDTSYTNFRKYMDYVFTYANTRSLFNELVPTLLDSMQIGDVFIQKGNPYGHAVIVVDMAENPQTGQKVFMLAQSYMPAQEIQILVNPQNLKISPWYELKPGTIYTPEWTFESSDLRCFDDS